MTEETALDFKTRKFIRSRRIDAILPWFGILGMLILVFSLIMQGFLVFFKEIGFVANFYYFIDGYNWLADRLMFNPRERILTHERDKLVRIVRWLFLVLTLIATAVLIKLAEGNFLQFVTGLCFLSICYLSSRVIENCMVLLHLQLNNWKRFYIIVAAGTIILSSLSIGLLMWNLLSYYVFLGILGLVYTCTYYILIEVYRRIENDLGGHKYFIDLLDNRFAKKFF